MQQASNGAMRLAVVLTFVLVGCSRGKGGDSVTISGDIPGLDSVAMRGGALLARSYRDSLLLDSMRVAIDRQLRAKIDSESVGGAADAASPGRAPAGKEMSERAYARADSILHAGVPGKGKPLAGATASPDTMRGVVLLAGTASAPTVMLLTNHGETQISLSGMATTGLMKLAGTEVVVRGVQVSPRDVVVSDYIVRAVKGVPAYDGVLAQGDAGWTLLLTDGTGRRRLAAVPAALRASVGLRVWLSSKTTNESTDGFGVIRR